MSYIVILMSFQTFSSINYASTSPVYANKEFKIPTKDV